MARSWYFLQVRTNFENKVRTLVEKTVHEEYPLHVGQVKIPEEEFVDFKNGKKKTSRRKLYPGYILIELDLPEAPVEWKPVLTTITKVNGVVGFVGVARGERPVPIPQDEIKQIFTKMGEIKGVEGVPQQVHFAVGDKVKVIDGPFNDFEGSIEEINVDKGKLKVTVEIFGRKAPVEIGFPQVVRI